MFKNLIYRLQAFTSKRAVLFWSLALLISFFGIERATAREHITIKLDSVVCVEESNEIGDDDAFLVSIGLNLRTGRTRALSYAFLNAASGDQFPIPNGKGIVFADWIDHPSDLLVIVALVEFDANGFNTGYIMQGGENGLGRVMANRVQQQLDPLAKQYSQFTKPKVAVPEIAVQALRDKMRRIVEQNLGDNELLGFYHIRMQPNGFWQNWATGDGARYQINMKRTSGTVTADKNLTLAKNSKLRFRIRDEATGRPLSARVQLIRNGQVTVDRHASSEGKFEQSVVPGLYQVRFTMKTPHVSHHTTVQSVRIESKDVYRDIFLKPIHSGKHVPPPGSPLNLDGTWQAQLFGQTVTYQIKQTGNSFNWSQPLFNEAATGTILNGSQVVVTLHGPNAPHPPVIHGTVKRDAGGKAIEIMWTNNVRFTR